MFHKTDFIYLCIENTEHNTNIMTLQQMQYIVAVDKYRHFARAAESCGVSQSTLSSLIQKLEFELDVTIFDRNCHPVRPTAIGEEIIGRIQKVLFNAAQVRELVSARKGESVGKVSLGIISTVAPYLLPGIFRYLSADRFPTYSSMWRKHAYPPLFPDLNAESLMWRSWPHRSATMSCLKYPSIVNV